MNEHTKKIIRMLISIAVAFIICTVTSFISFAKSCDTLRESVIRLHILANSNSTSDQADKLAVRDALLPYFEQVFDKATTLADAKQRAESKLSEFELIAEQTLAKRGTHESVKAVLVNDYFNTTEYSNFVMPAGYYDAVRILIGNAAGKNWFCVAFPPICLGAATAKTTDSNEVAATLTDGKLKVTQKSTGYQIRFKLVEVLESLHKGKK